MAGRDPDFTVFSYEFDHKGQPLMNSEGQQRRTIIGAAWRTQSGDGINVKLKALPLGSQLALWPFERKDRS